MRNADKRGKAPIPIRISAKRPLVVSMKRSTLSADRRFNQENAALRMNGRSGEAAPQRIDGRPRSAVGRKCQWSAKAFVANAALHTFRQEGRKPDIRCSRQHHLTTADLLINSQGVRDENQLVLLNELRRFLTHERIGRRVEVSFTVFPFD